MAEQAGPLAEWVPGYIAGSKRGLTPCGIVSRSLAALAHFAHGKSLCRLRAASLDEGRVDQFLHDHLPHGGCASRAMCRLREAQAAPMPMQAMLRQQSVVAELSVSAEGPMDPRRALAVPASRRLGRDKTRYVAPVGAARRWIRNLPISLATCIQWAISCILGIAG